MRALILPLALMLATPAAAQFTPRAAVDGLIAADRTFSDAAGAATNPAAGIAAAFDAEVTLQTRQGFVTGREAAAASLAANPTLAGRRARWRPIRAGVSADGTQGFTYGYVQVEGAPPERAHARYLAYWVRRPEGWRIAAYRQVPQQAGAATLDQLPPVLPDRIVTPEPGQIAAHQQSLAAAEQAFSDLAQHIGLAAAFTENGTAQSMNMGSPAGFVIGNAAIGRLFPPATRSPVSWGADRVIVASSGDLGVTIGHIRLNGPAPEGQPAEIPFFTIWHRADPGDPWRYIAE